MSHRMSTHIVSIFTLLAVLSTTRVSAQEAPKTDPFPLANPTTGEPGMWTPVWLQQEILKTDAALKSCSAERAAQMQILHEDALQLHDLSAADTELQQGLETLKKQVALEHTLATQADNKAQTRLYWAIGSTGAAAVAILILLVEHL